MNYLERHPSMYWIGIGFVLQFLSGPAMGVGFGFGMIVLAVAEGISLTGCGMYMAEKGWPDFLSLLGLLNVLGLLILLCLPDRKRD